MTINVSDAQLRLGELIAKATAGEEVVITQNNVPVARLVAEMPMPPQPRVPGSAKGMITYMADDFDAPLEDFKEYME
jgi:prevent-host-death family protein